MTKEKDRRKWFDCVISSVNYITFCDSASKAMMTAVHDSTIKEYAYFSAVKWPGASPKYSKSTSSTQAAESPESGPIKAGQRWQLRKPYALDTYNQNMGGSDNHAKQNSYYSTAVHYHRRNGLPLFYFLLDAAITNSYILYKLGAKGKKKLSHVKFQEQIARSLLRGPGAILRQRRPRPPKASIHPHTKIAQKDDYKGHSWASLDSYRRCQVCNPNAKRGRPRKAFQEHSVNVPGNAKRSKKCIHQTIHACSKSSIPICHNSRCWEPHLPIL
jgi:Transposase IS4